MKTDKLITIGKFIAFAILILGLIHDIATFSPLIQEGLTCLTPGNLNAMIYMSLMCGTSLILCGTLLVIMLKKGKQITFYGLPMMVIGIFLALNGILSVAFMLDNPFAWVALLLNLSMLGIITKLRTDIAIKTSQHDEVGLQSIPSESKQL